MTTAATVRTIEQWRLHNDEYLATALAWLRSRLDGLGRSDGSIAPSEEETKPLYEDLLEAEQSSPPPPIVLLSKAFDLSRFEQEVVLLCAAMELDTSMGARCAAASGDLVRPYPTFALAMALLDKPNWTALSPVGALRRWRLIEFDDHPLEPLIRRSLRANERVLHFVKGLNVLDERLARVLRPLDEPSGALPPSQQAVADAVVRAVLDSPGQIRQLVGHNRPSTRSIARAAARQLGLSLYEVSVGALPAGAGDIELFARLWEREARLLPLAIVVDATVVEPGDALEPAIARLADVSAAPVFLTRRVVCTGLTAASTVHDVATPTPAEQRNLWHHAVADDTAAEPARLAAEFDFDTSEIERVGAALRDEDRPSGHAWAESKALSRPQLESLAQRLTPKATWADIVLGAEPIRLLRTLTDQARHRGVVYDDWGWRQRTGRGLGISALFTGESGTGKTMAAEVIANDLEVDLYRVDLSGIVSKYIGETEKNLRVLFDAAERGGALLLFDEADALFGRRSEVRDSHDRYANIEIDYLLQRMETYRGLAILTTNMRSALDPAFTRRLRFIVAFTLPGLAEREQMWRRAFPPQVPTDRLDATRLARLNLSGALIHAVAMHACFLAAADGSAVTMAHVLDAAKTELRKLERPTNEAEAV